MVIPFYFYRILGSFFLPFLLGGLLLCTGSAVARAQVTLDGSLGPKGPLAGPAYTIDAKVGQLHGNNLFHSFGQFNVHTGESATFTGPSTVENVIGRVTGGQPSLIDGQLRSEMPKANVYLLNPSGVMFGSHATLDVPGSFHVSTADYLRMADGAKFSANLSQQSVLTAAPPATFGFLGSNPAPIGIQGSSLQVPEGKTLSVVGGDIHITGGSLAAPHGQLNLASMASAGEVLPTVGEQGADLKLEGFGRLGKIEATQGAHISTDGAGGGSIVIRGGRLVVDNATISSNTQGNADGARVGIDAQLADNVVITNAGRIETAVAGAGHGGDVRITAGSVEGNKSATIGSTTAPGSTGNGGSSELKVKQLTLADGARIDTSTHGSGRGGALNVTATDSISISGRDSKGAKSGLFGNALGKGDAGKLSVTAPTLTMADRGVIDAHTAGDGNAGDVEVQVGTLTLTSGAQIRSGSGVIEYKEGVLTSSGTGGPGRGGDLIVSAADTLSLSGGDSDGNPSGLFSNTVNRGDAGKLSVSVPLLQMNGGRIVAVTLGDGNAGDIDVQVRQLTLTGSAVISSGVGFRQFSYSSFPQISTGGPGRGGNLTVHATESISIFGGNNVRPGGGLTVSTGGKGDAGKLFVSAPVLLIDGGFFAGCICAFTVAEGNAGDIEVQVGKLTLQNGGQLFTGVGALSPDGKGGFILIGTDNSGRGGNITVNATESISMSGRSSLGLPSLLSTGTIKGSGAGGQIFVSAPLLDMGDGGEISSASLAAGTGNAGDIRLKVGKLTMSGDATISTGTEGPGQGGDIQVQARQIELNNSKAAIAASSSGSGNAGNIEIHADDTFRSRNSMVGTTSDLSGGGKIDLSAGQTVELVHSQITTTVQGGAGDAGNITIGPRFVILNDSQVIARAVEGNGGNIRIGADVFLASPTSVVDASSQKGISGTIDIRGVVNNLSGSIAPLPQGYLSTVALSADRCAGRLREGQVSSFVVAGREGMPLQPGGVLPSPLYEAGQVRAQGGPGRNDGRRVGWQVPRIIPASLNGGCGR